LLDIDASDESLLAAVNRGDLGAFEQIVRRHQAWVWRIAYRFLGDKEEAEDIAQEAFLRLLDASGRYKTTAKFTTYFYQVISRLCLDRARKKRPVYLEELPDCPDPRPGPLEEMERQEVSAGILAALGGLPPEYRIVIILRYFEGLSGQEIADVLKKTPKATERLLARARQSLEPLLRPYFE